MTAGPWRWSPLGVAFAFAFSAGDATAQTPGSRADDRTGAGPTVFAYVLRKAGNEELDPFGATGRREVLQLLAQPSALRGRFRRARVDRVGSDDWNVEGWYEIRGDIIMLIHADEHGATGRVETGRYLHGHICFVDPDDGRMLSYEYLSPTGEYAVPPPESPGAPRDGRCGPEALRS